MNKATQELIKLIKENPDLPIIPMVNYEVVGDGYAYWAAEFSSPQVDEYIIDSWYGDGCIRFKSNGDEDTIIEGIAEIKYGDCTKEENWEKADQELKSMWKKAIIVYIETPN